MYIDRYSRIQCLLIIIDHRNRVSRSMTLDDIIAELSPCRV